MSSKQTLVELVEEVDVSDSQDYELPRYSDKGWIIVEIISIEPDNLYKYEFDEYAYDGSAFWINEGEGIDYWLHEHVDIDKCGWWVIEGITGIYTKGDGWITDDDVDWDFEKVRPATQKEIDMIGVEDES